MLEQTEGCGLPLCVGIGKFAALAQKTCGTGKDIQYFDRDRASRFSPSLRTVLEEAVMNDPAMQVAAGLLTAVPVPADGVKTAVLLLDAFLSRACRCGLSIAQAAAAYPNIAQALKAHLARMAAEKNGCLPGAGLYLMNLVRPLLQYSRQEPEHAQTACVLSEVLSKPMEALAAAAGNDPCRAYERVKALAPNQFFSLHHFGLERSIDRSDAHTDVFSMGVDCTDDRVKDVFEAGITVPLQTGEQVLDYVGAVLQRLERVAVVLA